MTSKRKWFVNFLITQLCTVFIAVGVAAQENKNENKDNDTAPTAGIALDSIFNPRRAPQAKSMGLLQSNFLDAVKSQRKLQLAIVVDTTESMSAELAGVRGSIPNMLADLERMTDAQVSTAILTVADVGERDNPVSIVSPNFVSDAKAVATTIGELKAESGKPYFPEPVDLGIQKAITELEWSDDANTERWIMFVGDAPPYDSSFNEPETKSKRWYDTQRLIDLANERGISIHCLLCKSRESEKAAYDATVEKTRRFMSRLSSDTGGMMLDLSYPQVRQELVSRAGRQRTSYAKIGFVSRRDIDSIASVVQGDSDERLRIGVLPLMPLDSISFYFERPEVQIATELRQLMADASNLRMVSSRQLEKELLRLKAEAIPVDQWEQALCLRMRVDYIVSGTQRVIDQRQQVNLSVHHADDADPIAKLTVSADRENISRTLYGQLAKIANANPAFVPLRDRLATTIDSGNFKQTSAGMFAELSADAQSELFAGIEALEQALRYPPGDSNAVELLTSAEQKLATFSEANPRHAYGQSMLASCRYNVARFVETRGDQQAAKSKFDEALQSLDEAYLLRKSMPDKISQWEIEADYQLLVRRNYAEAIESYQRITTQNETSPVRHALRAHWMLAGIRGGDWGVANDSPELVDVEKCRQHLIKILAWWPNTVEAEAIRQSLQWDENRGRNKVAYLPREGELLLGEK